MEIALLLLGIGCWLVYSHVQATLYRNPEGTEAALANILLLGIIRTFVLVACIFVSLKIEFDVATYLEAFLESLFEFLEFVIGLDDSNQSYSFLPSAIWERLNTMAAITCDCFR